MSYIYPTNLIFGFLWCEIGYKGVQKVQHLDNHTIILDVDYPQWTDRHQEYRLFLTNHQRHARTVKKWDKQQLQVWKKWLLQPYIATLLLPMVILIGLFGYFKVMVTSSTETVSREESMSGQQCKTYQLATVSWEYWTLLFFIIEYIDKQFKWRWCLYLY